MKVFHGVLLKLAPRCEDSVSESMQVSQERPITITRVREHVDAHLGKELERPEQKSAYCT